MKALVDQPSSPVQKIRDFSLTAGLTRYDMYVAIDTYIGERMTQKLKTMREQVLAEMEYIPTRPKPAQSLLRMAYFTARMHSLGKKAKGDKSAYEVLQEAIVILKKDDPEMDFVYDRSFFKKAKK